MFDDIIPILMLIIWVCLLFISGKNVLDKLIEADWEKRKKKYDL